MWSKLYSDAFLYFGFVKFWVQSNRDLTIITGCDHYLLWPADLTSSPVHVSYACKILSWYITFRDIWKCEVFTANPKTHGVIINIPIYFEFAIKMLSIIGIAPSAGTIFFCKHHLNAKLKIPIWNGLSSTRSTNFIEDDLGK